MPSISEALPYVLMALGGVFAVCVVGIIAVTILNFID
jgi:hypothetical protein